MSQKPTFRGPDPVSATHEDQWASGSDTFKPLSNIDGTMMMGHLDVDGNMYGLIDISFDSRDGTTPWSMWDD